MNILHDEIIETVEFAGVIHLHDMRIGNGRGRTGFTMESFHELVPVRSLRQLGMHDFDGDRALQTFVYRLVHRGPCRHRRFC